MSLFDILHLIFTGLAISAPVGPISLLCMRTTLRSGLLLGLCAGLGAAAADATMCCAALNGLGPLLTASRLSASLLNGFAGAFLIYVAIEILQSNSKEHREINTAQVGAAKTFTSTYMYTALNPITIITFIAIFCSNQIAQAAFGTKLLASLCIFLGGSLWWLVLAIALSFARGLLNNKAKRAINISSAIMMLLFSAKLLCRL